jgi:hypothetical protein
MFDPSDRFHTDPFVRSKPQNGLHLRIFEFSAPTRAVVGRFSSPLPFSVASARLLLDEDKNLFRRADVGDANGRYYAQDSGEEGCE